MFKLNIFISLFLNIFKFLESKFLIHRKKLFEKRFEDLSNKRLLFQKYQFSIEEDTTNMGMLNTFKELNSFTKTNRMLFFI